VTTSSPPPLVPPAPRTSGKKGCLIGFALFAALGGGSLLLSKVLFDRKNASIIEGARELDAVLARAGEAPGAGDVRALGCEAAGVLAPDALPALARKLEEERAAKEKRAPHEVDPGATEPVVFCAHPAAGEPTCPKVALAYLRSAKPDGPFVVTVRTGYNEKCAERFDADGKSLGAAPSPKLPLLVSR
jgi:hypothetical protein